MIDPQAMTASDALQLARAAGGWEELREKANAYGEPGAIALRAYDLAQALATPPKDRDAMSDPAAVARYLTLRYSAHGQEVMGALWVDTRNRLIGQEEIFQGTANRAAVEPREILRRALVAGAVGMIIWHNHPSGDPAPSPEDQAMTRRLHDAGELVGVKLLDHLIIGSVGRWVSLRERGALG